MTLFPHLSDLISPPAPPGAAPSEVRERVGRDAQEVEDEPLAVAEFGGEALDHAACLAEHMALEGFEQLEDAAGGGGRTKPPTRSGSRIDVEWRRFSARCSSSPRRPLPSSYVRGGRGPNAAEIAPPKPPGGEISPLTSAERGYEALWDRHGRGRDANSRLSSGCTNCLRETLAVRSPATPSPLLAAATGRQEVMARLPGRPLPHSAALVERCNHL